MVRSKPAVMVVDDDPSFLPAVVRLIRTGGYDVQGFETIDGLRARLPLPATCCVLADVVLRGESGLEIPDMLSARGESAPVIFMSATEDRDKIEAASSVSAVPYLKKPLEACALFEALELALRGLERMSEPNHQ